jgi:hypothetical protein
MLMIHNLFRWLVILALLWVLLRAYRGWLGKKAWREADRRAYILLTIGYDVQFLVGLVLAFLSPIVATAFSNLGAAMQVAELRFFSVEHTPMMFIALVAGHITSVFSRRAQDDSGKHRRAALGFSIAAAITLLAIPWSRPLLRF